MKRYAIEGTIVLNLFSPDGGHDGYKLHAGIIEDNEKGTITFVATDGFRYETLDRSDLLEIYLENGSITFIKERPVVNVLIMQGVPGSGKTTWVEALVRKDPLKVFSVSADEFFMRDGKYQFDPKLIGDAHKQCFTRFLELCWGDLTDGVTLVVDNTNISAWEYSPYVRVAQALLKDPVIKLITCMRDIRHCIEQNTHGVPANLIMDMHKKLLMGERVPGVIQEYVFFND